MTPFALDAGATETAHLLLERAARDRWRGPDPYDALAFEWPRAFVGGKRRRQLLIQLHARAPLDIRRLYRRDHPVIAKTLALFGSTAVRLSRARSLDADVSRAHGHDALRELADDRLAGPAAWGYPWDVQTRWGFYRAGSPNIVVTSFAGVALLEAAAAWDAPAWGDRARTGASWVVSTLRHPGGYYVYHEGSASLIHNANLLGARLVYQTLGEQDSVLPAIERSLAAQAVDGSWPYGAGRGLEFVDNFHTAYVLDCLCHLESLDPRIPEAVARGSAFWLDRFFQQSGATTLWPDRPFPEDGHATGSALTTLAALVERGHAPREVLERAARHALERMIRHGHAVVRRHRIGATRHRYIRWCDAHLALGLANAASALAPGTERPPATNRLAAQGSRPLADISGSR